MKRILYLLMPIVAIMLLLTACPYESDVPIDEPSLKTDKAILGKWIKGNDLTQENPEYFVFEKFDQNKYKIIKNEYNTSDSAYRQTVYIAYFSLINDVHFLNMQESGKTTFFLYKLVFNQKDEFTLYELTDNIDEKFTSSNDLKQFIRENMHLSFFYNNDEVKYLKQQ